MVNQMDGLPDYISGLVIDGDFDDLVAAVFGTVRKPRLVDDFTKQRLGSLRVQERLEHFALSDELNPLRRHFARLVVCYPEVAGILVDHVDGAAKLQSIEHRDRTRTAAGVPVPAMPQAECELEPCGFPLQIVPSQND